MVSEAPKVPVEKLKKAFFYEIEKDGAKASLFGTMHVGVSIEMLPDFVIAALDHAGVFAGEWNVAKSAELAQFDGRRHAKKLGETLSAKEQSQLVARLQKQLNLSESTFVKTLVEDSTATEIYPVTFVDLSKVPKVKTSPVDVISTMLDEQLRARAASQSKTISFLDSARLAGDAVGCVMKSDAEFTRLLKKYIKTGKTESKALSSALGAIDATVSTYIAGDAVAIRKNARLLSPKIHECVIGERNRDWIGQIQRLTSIYPNPFIAVGVLHIENERDSLLELLKERGFKVRRIEAASNL